MGAVESMRGHASDMFHIPAEVSEVSWPMRRMARLLRDSLSSSLMLSTSWFCGDAEETRLWKALQIFSATHLLLE